MYIRFMNVRVQEFQQLYNDDLLKVVQFYFKIFLHSFFLF